MSFVYCVKLNGRKICWPIPVDYDRLWWLKPQPDPWRNISERLKPDPTPWQERFIIDEQLKESVQEELVVLASIEQLSKSLSGENKKLLAEALQKSVGRLDIPKDATVEFR